MTALAGFLDVLFHGVGLIALAVAVGGIVFILGMLRPWRPAGQLPMVRRSLRLTGASAAVLALCQALQLLLKPWALADEWGTWPLTAILTTGYGRAGLLRVAFALALAAAAAVLLRRPRSPGGWLIIVAVVVALLVDGAWLVHAASRLEERDPLMAATVLHQLGAAVWLGGAVHLLALWRLVRTAPGEVWPRVLARFSPVALVAVAVLLAHGLFLGRHYVGAWEGLIASGYGAMVLTKAALLGLALALGGLNFLATRAWHAYRSDAVTRRVPACLEAEVGVGCILLLCAASLASLPPAADVREQWATPAEVAVLFAPQAPRLMPPPRDEFLAAAVSVLDSFTLPGAIERARNEYNHHVAGLFVLAMGLLALLARSGRAPWARHWPLLFLGLAGFLFLEAEPTVWPLGPESFWQSLLVPAVLQHRLATLLVVALGIAEWRVHARRLPVGRAHHVFPLLCFVGGTILLTHSHTVFALKEEFLIEVSHALLGFFAVLAACGRWLELRLPAPGRVPGVLWTAALVLVGLTLLLYREPG